MNCHAQDENFKALLNHSDAAIRKNYPDSALLFSDSVLMLARSQGNRKYEIQAICEKAYAYTFLNQDKEAGLLYFEALHLCQQPGDDKMKAFILNELGYMNYKQGDYHTARNYFSQELVINEQLNDLKSQGNQLINLASIHRLLHEYDSAAFLLNKVKSLLTFEKDTVLKGAYWNEKGTLFQETGQVDSARIYYKKAENEWKLSGNLSQWYRSVFNRAELESQQKNTDLALSLYLVSDSIVSKLDFPNEELVIKKRLAEVYASRGEFEIAYSYTERAIKLSDSLKATDDAAFIARLDRQFQTEKNRQTIKDQQLLLQKQQNKLLLIITFSAIILFVLILFFVFYRIRRRINKKVDETKAKFFDNVVHEIRTPLSMIMAPIKLLVKNSSDPEVREQLQMAERNIVRLNQLINQMLDISKLSVSKYQLSEKFGDIVLFLETLVLSYEMKAKEKKLKFSCTIDIDKQHVLFDADALEKMIGNLLDNAIKYTPAGGQVALEVSMDEKEEPELIIKVSDTGIGISPNDLKKIFDRFYRTDEQLHSGTKGVGIGLSLVHELVNLMNGKIEVESNQGKGSVFILKLLLKKKQENDELSSENVFATILLVEDNPDIIQFNRKLLENENYKVICCSNGNEASDAMKSELPDIIITDLMMPEKDGLTLLKEIRANLVSEHIPVIILSAKSADATRIEGVKEGAQVFLSKPFVPDELLALVKSQLEILQKQRQLYRSSNEKKEQSIEERFAGTDPFTKQFFSLVIKSLDDSELTVETLADKMFINRSHFQRKMKTLTGYSPSELLRIIRLETALELLKAKEGNVTEVAYQCGFSSQSYFSKSFARHFGYAPSEVSVKSS